MKNVLVIGGRGYVGTAVLKHLQNLDINAVSYGSKNIDYNDIDAKYLNEFEYVVLLAGHSSVQMCIGDLASPWNNNVRNFSNLVKKLNKKQKLIYASSASVYGNKGHKLFDEQDLNLDYINNYDLTKTTLDLLALNFMSQDYQIIGLRFGTVNGASDVIRRDLMINSMVYSALKDGVINVNNKYVKRPILGINDLSQAIRTIVTSSFIPGVYNLASFNSNVDEISRIVSQVTGTKIIDKGDYPGIYNFEISANKFQSYYNFKFKEKINAIIPSVIDCYNNPTTQVVIRNEYFKYE